MPLQARYFMPYFWTLHPQASFSQSECLHWAQCFYPVHLNIIFDHPCLILIAAVTSKRIYVHEHASVHCSCHEALGLGVVIRGFWDMHHDSKTWMHVVNLVIGDWLWYCFFVINCPHSILDAIFDCDHPISTTLTYFWAETAIFMTNHSFSQIFSAQHLFWLLTCIFNHIWLLGTTFNRFHWQSPECFL